MIEMRAVFMSGVFIVHDGRPPSLSGVGAACAVCYLIAVCDTT
jgi:hypothetical protein